MSTRRVLLTGATRGLGRAMVAKFAELGHEVMGCGRSAAAIGELRGRYTAPHEFSVVDVASDGEVRAWAERLRGSGRVPDLLINNAAVINRKAPLWEVPPEEFSRVVEVNLMGTVHVLRWFVPAMIQGGGGLIVNLSSGWGRTTDAEVAPYCATKWAVEGLTQALAQELPRGLAAVALNPGIIDTDMLRSCFGGSASSYPSPAAWAERAVPFLLRLGPHHNGQPLTVPE